MYLVEKVQEKNDKDKLRRIQSQIQNIRQINYRLNQDPSAMNRIKDLTKNIQTSSITGGNQKIILNPFEEKIYFNNLQYGTEFYLNTRTGETNFKAPSYLDDLTVNNFRILSSMRVYPETKLLIGPSNLQSTYTVSGLVEQIIANRDKNTIQDQQIDDIITKNDTQDQELGRINQKNVEQDNRLSVIEAKNTEQDSRLSAIESKNSE